MPSLPRLVGQAVFYAIVCAAIGLLASWPRIQLVPAGSAEIKLSLAHSADRKVGCRRLSPQEIAKLPPSERRPNTCGRERVPMRVQFVIDGKRLYDATVEPLGLTKDGPARVYEKFVVPAGRHTIVARLKDKPDALEFDYEKEVVVHLKPHSSMAVDFKADVGGFIFYQ